MFVIISRNNTDEKLWKKIEENNGQTIKNTRAMASLVDKIEKEPFVYVYMSEDKDVYLQLGIAFALNKPIKLLNQVDRTKKKSMNNFINMWETFSINR